MKLPPSSRQAVVVTADEPAGGNLVLLERGGRFLRWRTVAGPVRVSLGRNGVASAHGRMEGDGKTPAGTYPLESAFGRAAQFPTRLPYLAMTRGHEAVDDPASRYYNRIVDRRNIARPDWRSSEQMLRSDHLYDLGVVVGYNTSPTVPGKGSCIFLHIWKSPGAPTSGCIAMPRRDLERLARRLDPAANPVIVISAAPRSPDKAGP